jgi:hypothetical protein
MKEISVMHILKRHPLIAHDVFHMGGTKVVLLLMMPFCEKFLVSAMESIGYYEEKKTLS